MIPLQIRFETEPTLGLLAASVGFEVETTLEFAYIHECEHGINLYSPGEEFACHDAACRPPRSGGTGGSDPKGASHSGGGESSFKTNYSVRSGGVGSAESASDVGRVNAKGTTGAGGLLTEKWQDEKTGEVRLTPKQDEAAVKKLAELGTSEKEWTANVAGVAARSMKEDPERAMQDAQWYQHEHDTWGAPLAKEHGMSVDQVMAMAASTSTNKQWDGVKSSNKEVVGNILKMLKDDISITVTKEQAASYNQFSIDKPGKGGKYGPRTIEPGQYKMSDLSSGVLSRVMGSGYKIGGQYGTDGLFKAFSVARGELSPNAAIGSLKQRSFTNNLSQPGKDYSSTNDFWMARALFGQKKLNLDGEHRTIREWEKATGQQANSFLGSTGGTTGSSSLYAVGTRASKTALAQLAKTDKRFVGMKIHEFQALVWVQMQREYAKAGEG